VGALARGAELEQRVAAVAKLSETHHIGFANIYTSLGRAVEDKALSGYARQIVGPARTFCNLPKQDIAMGQFFIKSVNDKAKDEPAAHMSMFEPRNNPGYYGMSERAKELVVSWVQGRWYDEATGRMAGLEEEAEIVDFNDDAEDDVGVREEEDFVDLKREV